MGDFLKEEDQCGANLRNKEKDKIMFSEIQQKTTQQSEFISDCIRSGIIIFWINEHHLSTKLGYLPKSNMC